MASSVKEKKQAKSLKIKIAIFNNNTFVWPIDIQIKFVGVLFETVAPIRSIVENVVKNWKTRSLSKIPKTSMPIEPATQH